MLGAIMVAATSGCIRYSSHQQAWQFGVRYCADRNPSNVLDESASGSKPARHPVPELGKSIPEELFGSGAVRWWWCWVRLEPYPPQPRPQTLPSYRLYPTHPFLNKSCPSKKWIYRPYQTALAG